MSPHDDLSATLRPIRELVWPAIESPLRTGELRGDRRHAQRYARRLPGAMIVEDREHPVLCFDVGYGGIRVLAPNKVSISLGQHVVVRIQQGTQSYQDRLSVVHYEPAEDGTAINLQL